MIRILGYGKPEEMKILRKLLTEISIQQNLADYQLDTFVVLEEWAAAIEKAELLDAGELERQINRMIHFSE